MTRRTYRVGSFKTGLEQQEETIQENIRHLNTSLRLIGYTDSTYVRTWCSVNLMPCCNRSLLRGQPPREVGPQGFCTSQHGQEENVSPSMACVEPVKSSQKSLSAERRKDTNIPSMQVSTDQADLVNRQMSEIKHTCQTAAVEEQREMVRTLIELNSLHYDIAEEHIVTLLSRPAYVASFREIAG